MERKIRHSILIITYNQQHLIGACLDSIFDNDVLPYEVIVGDDCSTDGTKQIVLNYQQRFPEILKWAPSEKNLGIFKNWNRLMKMATGDMISLIAGDDFFKKKMLATLNEVIIRENLDPQHEKFIIVTNSIELTPAGKEILYDNYQLRDKDVFKARIRYGISYREVGFSRKLYESLKPIPVDLGYHADWIHIIDQVVSSDKFYFINQAFSVYRLGEGVTSKTKTKQLLESKLQIIDEVGRRYSDRLDRSDRLFLSYWKARHEFILTPSWRLYWNLLLYQFRNIGNFTPNNNFFRNFRLLLSGPIRIFKRSAQNED
ncbi:glycosyltransferase family 2 protein [Pedobacter sp. SYP-B3415]|uniref:glycosyltransferase family 2 protein n=1 Tax=Pedobacter sp. SYP-B3415 TaxID=2496641 RepID=UPI00101D4E7B|nr:glycosyltransferase family 2 protein [Pedobacter sp. SYP-B3415]